jgi:hypothetical protein
MANGKTDPRTGAEEPSNVTAESLDLESLAADVVALAVKAGATASASSSA